MLYFTPAENTGRTDKQCNMKNDILESYFSTSMGWLFRVLFRPYNKTSVSLQVWNSSMVTCYKKTICVTICARKSKLRMCNNILSKRKTCMFTHRTEVGVLSNIMCQSIVTGRCRHDQQKRVPGLLSNGSFPMNEWHKQGEDQKICRALFSWCRLEQLFKNHRLPGHGHTDLVGMCKV